MASKNARRFIEPPLGYGGSLQGAALTVPPPCQRSQTPRGGSLFPRAGSSSTTPTARWASRVSRGSSAHRHGQAADQREPRAKIVEVRDDAAEGGLSAAQGRDGGQAIGRLGSEGLPRQRAP